MYGTKETDDRMNMRSGMQRHPSLPDSTQEPYNILKRYWIP